MKKLLSLLLVFTLVASLVVPAIAADGDVAETITTVEQLKDAAAKGGTYELGADIAVDEILAIEEALTIVGAKKDGGMYSITGTAGKVMEVYADLTLENVEIINQKNNGRCVDMRVDGITVNLTGAKLTATGGGNPQPFTIGGNGLGANGVADKTTVNITGSALDAGANGYGLISFNPAEINITNASVSSGYCAIYMREPDYCEGSRGSVINVVKSQLVGGNAHSGESNAFGTIVLQDKNVKVYVDADSTVSAAASGDQPQYLVLLNTDYYEDITGCVVDIKGTVSLAGKGELLLGFGKANNTILLPNTDAIKTQLEAEQVQYVANGNALQAIATITTAEQLKDAAANGGVYSLGADIAVDEGIIIEAGKELTLDLAGKTIARNTEAATSSAAITNNGNLTIKDSVGGGKITAFAQNPDTAEIPYYASNTITNCGVLTVQGGTIENSTSDAARAAFPIDNNSTIRDAITNIEGGTVTGRGAIRVYANSNTHKSELNITGGTVAGSSYGVWVQNPGSSDPKAALNISGGTVSKVLMSPSANFDIAITDGAVAEVAIWSADTTNTDRNPAAFITGGTFTVEPDAAFVADNCIITNVDGKYVVSVDYAATINRDGKAEAYLTLEEAVAAAADGETITLLKDVVLSEILKIEKALTIVGAEKADGMYSITGNGKNGSGTYKTIEVYADLTLENVEVINNKTAGRPVDMRNDGITLNVINSKLTATSAANNQLITVGGNGKGADGVADKTVVNVSGSTLTAGVAGYGIISFNPAEINITNASVSTGYNALYMKGISNSLGSAGSVINVKGSTLETFNNSTNPDSGHFGLFVTEDKNITFNVDAKSILKVEAKGAVSQYIIMNKTGSFNANIEPCTWMLIGDNAKVLGGAAGLTDSTLKFPSGDATKYQLRKCGYDYMAISENQVLVIDAHEHTNDPENDIYAHEVKKAEAKDPTCTAEGWNAYEYCTVCDYIFKVELPKTAHTMTKTEANEATCTADGNVEYYTCSVCEKTYADANGETELDDVVIKSEGHKMTKTEAKAATCTADGNVEYYTCSVCGKFFADANGETELDNVVIKSDGHKMTKEDGSKPSCTQPGFEAHYSCEICQKLYKDVEGKTEVKAHELLIPYTGHTMTKTEAKAATCTADGNVEYYTCSVCNKTFADKNGQNELTAAQLVIKTDGHKGVDVPAVKPTCTEAGKTMGSICSVCGETLTAQETIPAKGHDKAVVIPGVAPTCTEAGKTAGAKCSVCGEVTVEQETIPANGHDKAVVIPAVAATCTEAGKTAGAKCSVCGEVTVKQETIPAGHTIEKVEAKAPTYTEAGWEAYEYCTACDYTTKVEIAKLPTVEIEIPVIPEKPETPDVDAPETDKPETDAPETEDKEEVTVPEVKVEVKVEVKEEAAAEIIDKAVEEAKEKDEAPVVVIDVKKEVVETVQKQDNTVKEEEIKVAEVSIPTAAVEQVAKADEKATLAVNLTTATVIMDNKALETVAKEAEGKTVELKIDHVDVETLKEEQQAAVENKNVALTVSATLICAETKKEIGKEADGGFGGGTVTVAVPVPEKLPEGVKASDLKVYYVADDGTVTLVKSELKNGNIVFGLDHFSEYVIAAEKPASPSTGDNMSVALYGALAIMSVLGMAVVLKKKAF